MKFSKTWAAAAAVAAMVALSGTAQAGLVLQSNGLEVLDTDTNLLWLYSWNISGFKKWDDAKIWAAGLMIGGATAGDWRLPQFLEYLELWNNPSVGASLIGLQSEFYNVQPNAYWSGTEYRSNPGSAWAFGPKFGGFADVTKGSALYAVAVRSVVRPGDVVVPPGDVVVPPGEVVARVPEPQTLALALLALGATVVARRRRSR